MFALAALALLSVHAPPATATHGGPVRVASDAEFGAPHWTGSGTQADPYRLVPTAITPGSGYAIEIANTRKHVNLSGLTLSGGGSHLSAGSDGIRLTNVTNVTLWGSTLESDRYGVHVLRSRDVVIAGNTIKTSAIGVFLDGSGGVTLRDNRLALNDKDVALRLSSGNTLQGNNLSTATNQIGLFFEDNASYANAIDPSNVVNGVPVRWYSGVSNVVLSDVVVDLAGITNVAQIMLHNATDVKLERAVARSGVGHGIVVVRGAAVTVAAPVVENNAHSGVLLDQSTSTRIADASVRGSGLSGVAVQSGRNTTIESSVFSGNAREAIRAVNATSALVLRDVASGSNGRQALYADKVADVRIERGSFDGDALTFATVGNVSVRDTTLTEAGIVLTASAGAHLANVSVLRSPADGIAFSGGSDLRVDASHVASPRAHGLHATKSASVNVTGTIVEDAGGSAIRASDVAGLQLHDNTIARAGDAGIFLDGMPAGALLGGNKISNATNGIRFARTEHAELRSNSIAMPFNATGLRFDDETSYNNIIPATNLVNGAPVHWYTALVGSASAPFQLPGVRSEVPGITNVAQVMLYRSFEVELRDAVATNGTRGIYVYRSSAVSIAGANVSDNRHAGIELNASQSSSVRDVDAQRSGVGVRLVDSLANVVSGVDARGTASGVRLTRGSRDNQVDAIEVDGRAGGIVDEGWNGSSLRGNNLLADAGAARRVAIGDVVNVTDLSVSYRHESDRVVEQRWSWGDGSIGTSTTGDGLLVPSHTFALPGIYRAALEVTFATGLVLRDATSIEVVGPLSEPRELEAIIHNGTATLSWREPASDGARQIVGYRVSRGSNESDIVFVANATGLAWSEDAVDENASHVYAVSAYTNASDGPRAIVTATVLRPPGEANSSTNESATNETDEPDGPRRPARTTPPPREEPAETPLPLVVVMGALLVATAFFRRRR